MYKSLKMVSPRGMYLGMVQTFDVQDIGFSGGKSFEFSLSHPSSNMLTVYSDGHLCSGQANFIT